MPMVTGWYEVDEHCKGKPFKCKWCKANVGAFKPVFYLAKGKMYIPFCSRECRDQQLAEWAMKKTLKEDGQIPLF